MATKLLDLDAGGRQHIDRYELIGEIASGGMATVYLARLTGVGGFQRFFAIKRLHPHLATEGEFVEMFLDEARLAAGIHHPNVVPILEVGAGATGYYIVMEYIEGDTLARLLARAASKGSRIPASITVRLTVDMLHGLHAAHELRDETGQPTNLVHRDVSPQNILVGADGVTRITDFGVARAASRLTATRVGQLKGKLAYMAPEQAAGTESLDRRADIFASGIVLWEALAQKRLFKAENEAATLARVMTEPVPHLNRTAPKVPREIAEVVMKALSRDPDQRFSTCAEFADTLERAAVATGQMAQSRDVQRYVAEVVGGEIQAQREAVRAWLARSESARRAAPLETPRAPGSSVSSASMALPSSEVSVSLSGLSTASQRGGLGRIVGLVALAVLGAAGFLVYKNLSVRQSTDEGAMSAATPQSPVEAPPVAKDAASEAAIDDAAADSDAPSELGIDEPGDDELDNAKAANDGDGADDASESTSTAPQEIAPVQPVTKPRRIQPAEQDADAAPPPTKKTEPSSSKTSTPGPLDRLKKNPYR